MGKKNTPHHPVVNYSATFESCGWDTAFQVPDGNINHLGGYLDFPFVSNFTLHRTINEAVKIQNITFNTLQEQHPAHVYLDGNVFSLPEAEKYFPEERYPELKNIKQKIEHGAGLMNSIEAPAPVGVVQDRNNTLKAFYANDMTAKKNEAGVWEMREYGKKFGQPNAIPLFTPKKKWVGKLLSLIPGMKN